MRGVGISLAEKPQKGSARGCREGFSGCSTRPWRDMPPAGWNGFPSGCQGNLWSTPPPPSPPASATTLRLHRARVKLSTRAQAHGKPHHTHCYTDGKIQCASLPTERTRRIHTSGESWTPHCCERPCWIRYSANAPHSPFFCTALDDDERTSVGRVSHCFLSSVCQNFLKCIRTKNRVIFFISKKEFWGFKESFVRENEDFIEESKLAAVY